MLGGGYEHLTDLFLGAVADEKDGGRGAGGGSTTRTRAGGFHVGKVSGKWLAGKRKGDWVEGKMP
jgi:hypothetical protein